MKEHKGWMAEAQEEAEKSPVSGRKVGCVIVGEDTVRGHNRIPEELKGVDVLPHKLTLCAELVALAQMEEGLGTMYVWPVPPCPACTMAIGISDLIERVVVPAPDPDHPTLGKRWGARWEWSKKVFDACFIEVTELDEKAEVE